MEMKIGSENWIKAIIYILIVGMSSVLIFVGVSKYHAKYLFEKTRTNEKVYTYETYFGALNSAMYVDDLNDTSELINYYTKLEKNDTPAYINFPIKTMRITLHNPMYVYKYMNKSSKIVELIDFDTVCWGYMKGYLFKPTVHSYPPPDSLIKKEEDFMKSYSLDPTVIRNSKYVESNNDYGCYCKATN